MQCSSTWQQTEIASHRGGDVRSTCVTRTPETSRLGPSGVTPVWRRKKSIRTYQILPMQSTSWASLWLPQSVSRVSSSTEFYRFRHPSTFRPFGVACNFSSKSDSVDWIKMGRCLADVRDPVSGGPTVRARPTRRRVPVFENRAFKRTRLQFFFWTWKDTTGTNRTITGFAIRI